MQLLEHCQLGIRGQAATGILDAQLAGDFTHHRRAVTGQQVNVPAPRARSGNQVGSILAQAVVEDEPGQWALFVAQQQPLAVLAGNRWYGLAVQGANEARLAYA